MPSTKKLLTAAAGSAGGDKLYVEDVFSTYLYEGTGSSLTINNGLDLSGEGGLTWLKSRSLAEVSILVDTENGAGKGLTSVSTSALFTIASVTAFNSNGFAIGNDNIVNTNNSTNTSWSFRKAEGFFDVVTYTGNGTAGRTVAHSLGSVPKMIIIKSTSTSGTNWSVYHVSLGADNYILLNSTNQSASSGFTRTVNSTQFELGPNWADENASSRTYVAYLFGDDAVFGEDADEQICKIGSYTGTGSNGNTITLGFEPQWLMWKPSSGTGDWQIVDSMRGWTADGVANRLEPNTSDAEALTGSSYCNLTSTGFVQNGSSGSNNASGTTYIYMAIRRPMKVPEAGTEVFSLTAFTGNGSAVNISSGFPVDLAIPAKRTNTVYFNFRDRLRGSKRNIFNYHQQIQNILTHL